MLEGVENTNKLQWKTCNEYSCRRFYILITGGGWTGIEESSYIKLQNSARLQREQNMILFFMKIILQPTNIRIADRIIKNLKASCTSKNQKSNDWIFDKYKVQNPTVESIAGRTFFGRNILFIAQNISPVKKLATSWNTHVVYIIS